MPDPRTTRLVCAACGYDRSGTPDRACPECGSTTEPIVDASPLDGARRYPRRVFVPLLTLLVVGGAFLIRLIQVPDAQNGCGVGLFARRLRRIQSKLLGFPFGV
ncbi:MAG: hypothetical protein K2Q20_11460, partial [Phycisphaerales bacterium]|nr:hypothetical protein [Phycisphaerales bacterium]